MLTGFRFAGDPDIHVAHLTAPSAQNAVEHYGQVKDFVALTIYPPLVCWLGPKQNRAEIIRFARLVRVTAVHT